MVHDCISQGYDVINNLEDLLAKVDSTLAKTERVVFSSGNEVDVKALTVHEFEQINDLYARYGGTPDALEGNLFTVCSIVRATVHVETGARIFTDTDVPRMRDELSFATFRQLVQAFDKVNGGAEEANEEDGDDIVKKPSGDSLHGNDCSTA